MEKDSLCVVLKVHTFLARWLSWLERRPVTAEVVGSNPIRVVCPQGYILIRIWDLSSAGRASALQAEGHRFESPKVHFLFILLIMAWWLSWLERRPVTAEVVGSNPIRVVYNYIL